MKVTATTLPRRSLRARRAPPWVVSVKAGAGPILDRRASPLASWPPTLVGKAHVARARSAARYRGLGRPTLAFQLLLRLVEESPVRAFGDQLLWAALHHPGFPQAERVEAHGLLRVVLPPAAEGDLGHRLADELWSALEAPIRKCPRAPARLRGAELIALEDGTESALGRHGVSPDELTVGRDQAAEVLGPGAVDGAVEQDPPDP